MDKKGFVTIKIVIFVSILISVFLLFSNHLKFRLAINDLKRNQKTQLESHMANFDTLLFKDYGLYGLIEAKHKGFYKSNASNDNQSIEVLSTGNLSEYEVIKIQIHNFMKPRMPINYMDQLRKKFELILESGETKKSLEVLDQVYEVLKDFDNILKEKVVLIFKINSFKAKNERIILENIENQWLVFLETYAAYDQEILLSDQLVYDAFVSYENFRLWCLEQKEISQEDQKILEEKFEILSQAKNDNESLRSEQLNYEARGKDIVGQVENYKKKIEHLILTHDQVLDIIDALILKEETLKHEMDEAYVNIKNSQGLPQVIEVLDEELMSIKSKVQTNKISKEDYEKLAETIISNKILLETLLATFRDDYKNAFENKEVFESKAKKLIYNYNNELASIDYPNTYAHDPESDLIYKGSLEKTQETYEPHPSGTTIEKNMPIQDVSGESNFWSLIGLKDQINHMYESLMVNEYLLGTLKAGALSSNGEMDFFDKYQRPSFFVRGELEYILFGKSSEKRNLSKTWASIYGVRVIMNGMHVYLDKEKLLLSESIGLGVAGWTGFLGPVVTQVVRLAWAMGESAYDIKILLEGDSVPFLKLFPSEWHLDIGLKIKEKRVSPKLSHFTYHDYLRFFLMTMDTDLKIIRFQNLLVLNLYNQGHVYDLSLYQTNFLSRGFIRHKNLDYKSTIELGY